jgi:hypothetical protein
VVFDGERQQLVRISSRPRFGTRPTSFGPEIVGNRLATSRHRKFQCDPQPAVLRRDGTSSVGETKSDNSLAGLAERFFVLLVPGIVCEAL